MNSEVEVQDTPSESPAETPEVKKKAKKKKAPKPKKNKKLLESGVLTLVFTLFLLALLVVGFLVASFSFQFGFRQGKQKAKQETKITTDGEAISLEAIQAIQLQNDLLKKEADAAKQERDISLSNLENLRKEIDDVEVTNLQVNQTLEFYKKTISKQGGIDLQVIGSKIEPLPEGAFEYRFDVAMLAKDGKAKKLKPTLTLLNDTSFVDVPINPSSYDIAGIARIRGRFIMPDGFKPRQVQLKLRSNRTEIEQLYNWRLGKRKKDMPLSLSEIPQTDQRPISND